MIGGGGGDSVMGKLGVYDVYWLNPDFNLGMMWYHTLKQGLKITDIKII